MKSKLLFNHMATLQAYQLNGRDIVSLSAKVSNLPAGAKTSDVEMAYTSKWDGHSAGSFEFTEQTLKDIVANFNAAPEALPVYFGHPNHELGLPMPAAGWVKALTVKPSDKGLSLWGTVEWTEDTAASIKKGEYRYCSVVVDFAPVDRKTGNPAGEAKMYELGLVGSPFLPGMQAISLSQTIVNKRKLEMKKTDKAPVELTPEELAAQEALAKEAADKAKLADPAIEEAKLPADEEATEPEAEVKNEQLDPALESKELGDMLVVATGLAMPELLKAVNDNLEAVVTAINSSKLVMPEVVPVDPAMMACDPRKALSDTIHADTAAVLADEVAVLKAQVVELSAYKAAVDAKETEGRIEQSFSRLLKEGKVSLSQKPMFVKASKVNEVDTLEIYESFKAVAPVAGRQLVTGLSASPVKAPGVKAGAELEETEEVSMLRLSARGQGLKGIHIDEFVRRALANKASRCSE